MMTSRFAVGSVSTLAMGALLLGTASFWLNRPGAAPRAAPWGDLASLSASPDVDHGDDKAQLLKLAALKTGGDAPAAAPLSVAATPAPVAAPAPDAAAAVVTPLVEPAQAQAPAPAPVQMASAGDAATAVEAAPAPEADAAKTDTLNLNTASADALDHVGAGHIGRAIVSHRPYRSVKDLVNKRVLRTSDYQKIASRVRVD